LDVCPWYLSLLEESIKQTTRRLIWCKAMTNIHKLGFKRSPQEQPEIDQHKLPPLDLDYCPRCGEEIAEIIWE
jgi:hypothetical protein